MESGKGTQNPKYKNKQILYIQTASKHFVGWFESLQAREVSNTTPEDTTPTSYMQGVPHPDDITSVVYSASHLQ